MHVHPATLNWREDELRKLSTTTGDITLPNFDISTFRYFTEYLYTGRFRCGVYVENSPLRDCEEFVDVYLLAEKVSDEDLMDAALSAILSIGRTEHETGDYWLPTAKAIENAYKQTNKSSKLRKLLVDLWLWRCDLDDPDDPADFPKEFLWDLAATAIKKVRKVSSNEFLPASMKCCDYHQHKKGEPCANRKRKRDKADE
ncbi:uncharacterized protein RHO25_010769 [Cercospora beticola]|uniref:BTB domain-containing protein n=1 Tax=Cercospora beticola TaxID=122368 RepID=A0ABZ0P2N5_CERBT|nr:hypothetical protein RHO25_010769 [Cercospora beticola]